MEENLGQIDSLSQLAGGGIPKEYAAMFAERSQEERDSVWRISPRVAILKTSALTSDFLVFIREQFPNIVIAVAMEDITEEELLKKPVSLGPPSTGMLHYADRASELCFQPEDSDPTMRGNGRRKIIVSESGFPYPAPRQRKGRR